MKDFKEFYGDWAHEKILEKLPKVGYENAQITTIEGFIECTSSIYTDVTMGNLHLVELLELMSSILTDYYFNGGDAFGHTKEICNLVRKVDERIELIYKYDFE